MSGGGFCTACGWKVATFEGLTGCPQCGSKSVPCGDADQVQISINWHELRILCCWAERWAISACEKEPSAPGRGTVYAIADRIAAQHRGRTALTLSGEINSLRDAGYDVRTNIPGEER